YLVFELKLTKDPSVHGRQSPPKSTSAVHCILSQLPVEKGERANPTLLLPRLLRPRLIVKTARRGLPAVMKLLLKSYRQHVLLHARSALRRRAFPKRPTGL